MDALENIFIYEGQQRYEIVFVFDAEFADKSLYDLNEIDGYEWEVNIRFKAKWLLFISFQSRSRKKIFHLV